MTRALYLIQTLHACSVCNANSVLWAAYQHPLLYVDVCGKCYYCLFLCLCICICQQRREENEQFQRDKMVQAKNEFKVLKEAKKIDYM